MELLKGNISLQLFYVVDWRYLTGCESRRVRVIVILRDLFIRTRDIILSLYKNFHNVASAMFGNIDLMMPFIRRF